MHVNALDEVYMYIEIISKVSHTYGHIYVRYYTACASVDIEQYLKYSWVVLCCPVISGGHFNSSTRNLAIPK